VRVVSLVPSITETLLAWGVTPVAVTRFCEQPHLEAVGGTKDPDLDRIVALAPDVVLMDEEENRREDHDALIEAGVGLHVTAVRSIDDVAPTLASIARRVGVEPPAAPVGALLPADPPAESVRALTLIWRRPWMALGRATYGSTLLERLGLGNVVDFDGADYPELARDELGRVGASTVLLPSEPYPFTQRHVDEVERLAGCPTVLVDGKDLFWWGVRTAGAAERLRNQLAGVVSSSGRP